MKNPNNPLAFPVAEDHRIAADFPWTTGMTLRDYFAAKSIQGLLASNERNGVVTTAYSLADAMLAEREKDLFTPPTPTGEE